MRRLFLIWGIFFCAQAVNAQDIPPMGKSMGRSTSFSFESMKENKAEGLDLDSLSFVNTSWEITELEKGAQAMYAQVPMFYSTQSICVVKYPMKKFKTEILNRPELQSGKLSEIAEEVGASFAVNAGYFHMKEMVLSVYFREGRQQMGYTHPTHIR